MSIQPQHVANYFLKKAQEEGWPVTPLKLLILVYIAYGWVAAVLRRKLFEEPLEAWEHGPVTPSLYHEFKCYKNSPIEGLSLVLDMDNLEALSCPEVPKEERDVIFLLGYVWDVYKRFAAGDLRRKALEPGTPWHETWDARGLCKSIPYELFEDYFERQLNGYMDDTEKQPTTDAA